MHATHIATGFARRSEAFYCWQERSKHFTGIDYTDTDLKIAFRGMSHLGLNPTAMILLHHLVDLCDHTKVAEGEAFVWPSNRYIHRCTGLSESQIRTAKRTLEDAGLILRLYSHRNQPLTGASVSLAPFFMRLPDFMDRAAEISDEMAAERAMLNDQFDSHISVGDPSKNLNHIQTPPKILNTVPRQPSASPHETVAAVNGTSSLGAGREDNNKSQTSTHTGHHQTARQDRANLPSRQASASVNIETLPSMTELIEDIQNRLSVIIKEITWSPTLTDALTKPILKTDAPINVLENLTQAIARIWPDRNTANHTWPWALRKYGSKAIQLLIVALEDDKISNGQGWFGHMATNWDQDLILEPNLKRVRLKAAASALKTSEPKMARKPKRKPTELDREIIRIIGEPWWISWCQTLDHFADGDHVKIYVPHRMVKDQFINYKNQDIGFAITALYGPDATWDIIVGVPESS